MATIPIEIIDLRIGQKDNFAPIIASMNQQQNEFHFSFLDNSKATDLFLAIRDETDIGDFSHFFFQKKEHWRGYHPFIICLFDSPIHNDGIRNLFSVDISSKGFAALTTHNVATILVPNEKLPAYISFELTLLSLKLAGADLPFHDKDGACIYGYRQMKIEILNAILNARICDACKSLLQERNGILSTPQLDAVLTLLRLTRTTFDALGKNTPSSRLRVFVGSSTEGLPIARAIQTELGSEYDVEIWNQSDVFGLGTVTIEALENAVNSYDFGVFVFTPDDELISREETRLTARDNVIFEAGLFIGKLGRYKSFIVKPIDRKIQVPSDLNGLAIAHYDGTKANYQAAVGIACNKIRAAIAKRTTNA